MKAKVVVASAMLFLSCCSAVCAQWPLQTYGTRPGWEVEMGARILDRPGSSQDIPLVTDSVLLTTLFDNEDATDLQVSGGLDFRFQKMTHYDMTWEVRGYFNQWDSSQSVTGALAAPNFTPAGLPANTQLTQFNYDYESDLFDIEVNFKRAIQPGCTLMAGPRIMTLDEVAEVNTNFFNPTSGDFLQIETNSEVKNPLIGLGIGAEFRRPVCRDIFFVGIVRGGIFHNSATSTLTSAQTLSGQPNGTVTLLDDRETNTAGIGEISVRLHYDIVPGNISIYTGYEAMWLDGVALAPAQILSASTPAIPFINTDNTVFAQGASAGCMIRF